MLCLLLAGLAAGSAFSADTVSIRGTVRTLDATRGKDVAVRRGSVQSGSRSQCLEVELKVLQSSAVTNVRVSWLVLATAPKGRSDHVVARGEQITNLTRMAATKVSTESFSLMERDVQHRGRVSELEEEVSAWGVRVEDLQGTLLAERIEPASQAAHLRDNWDTRKRDR